MDTNKEDEWADEWPKINSRREKVILKNLPSGFTITGLRSMAEMYGNVVSVKQPPNAQFAFITYESAEEANNILRRFNDDNPQFNIIVEIAYEKEFVSDTNGDEYEFLDKPMMIEDTTPLRNVLEMSTRRIKGPFIDPVEIQHNSLVELKDYRNRFLLLADPVKEFYWESNVQANIAYETNNQKKIVNGRAILASSSVKTVAHNSSVASKKATLSFNSDLLPALRKCEYCPQTADKLCKKCDKTVCSLECHEANHKKDAGTDEDGQLSGTPSSLIPNRIEAEPIGQTVKITCVINHRIVFVRPSSDQQEVAFVRLMNNTVRCAKNADTLKTIPPVGFLVLAKFDYYQRALVLKHIDKTNVVVAFIDFGNVETFDFHELKAIPDELKKIKRLATKVRLSKIDDDIMNEKTLVYLYNLMAHDKELSIKIDRSSGTPMAELQASDRWVNQMVNSLNIEDVKEANIKDMSYRIFFEKDFHERCYKNFDHTKVSGKEVIILNNSLSLLTFIETDHLERFLLNDRKVQNICNYLFKEAKCYTPKTDECCVVKHKGRWYRGYVLEVCFDGFVTMHFIDYGNMQLIEVNDIRPIPDALIFECFVIEADCYVDHENITDEILQDLKTKYTEKSRHKIKRMESRKGTDCIGRDTSSLVVWF